MDARAQMIARIKNKQNNPISSIKQEEEIKREFPVPIIISVPKRKFLILNKIETKTSNVPKPISIEKLIDKTLKPPETNEMIEEECDFATHLLYQKMNPDKYKDDGNKSPGCEYDQDMLLTPPTFNAEHKKNFLLNNGVPPEKVEKLSKELDDVAKDMLKKYQDSQDPVIAIKRIKKS
jgi:hypothetical protein